MPRGTGRQHRESGERKTCCLLGNRLSEMYIMSDFYDLDRENKYTPHSCILDKICSNECYCALLVVSGLSLRPGELVKACETEEVCTRGE